MKLNNLMYYRGHKVRKALQKAELHGIRNCIWEIRCKRNDCMHELSFWKGKLRKDEIVVLRAKIEAFNSLLDKFGKDGERIASARWPDSRISI